VTTRTDGLFVVGIGASAGGIQAVKQFFEAVPPDTGLAFVVILHLSPDHDSQLASVVQASANLLVTQVQERVRVQPNHVYVIPPNRSLAMQDGYLAVADITRIEERRAPVDVFFRTLAESHGANAACVVLSGTGANGSMGLKRVKEEGGLCLVQDPDEADYGDMPRNAIATGLVDHILPVREIPSRILAYRASLAAVRVPEDAASADGEDAQALRDVFSLLRARTGHDFSNYKRATVSRRIARRMVVHGVSSLAAYAKLMRERLEEAPALLKDLLISVTNFFRDREGFDALEKQVIPRLFDAKGEEDQVRVWVPGCATGEEAYSIAMLLVEYASDKPGAPGVIVFATDIDGDAIAAARGGFYTLNDAADVSVERLRRFFVRDGEAYRARKELREIILFAQQNILKDPPFSHLDLVSCRNLLIYLNRPAQRRVMEVAHFALNPSGYLFLGASESIEGAGDLFVSVDAEAHLYQSRGNVTRAALPVPEVAPLHHVAAPRGGEAKGTNWPRTTSAATHLRLLEEFAPPSVLVNDEHELVHLSERAGRYLQFAGGEPSQNLLRLVRPELRIELHSALYQAANLHVPVDAKGLRVRVDDRVVTVDVHVRPVIGDAEPARGYFLVLFEEVRDDGGELSAPPVSLQDGGAARQLEEEVHRVKLQLRAAVERHDTQSEELRASNEELQAMNEELRSSAEELETSKEELQSMNEELRTVNQELKIKVEEQAQAANDMQNLINSTDIGTIFLDRQLRLKMYTPGVRQFYRFIPSDLGRPLSDLTTSLTHIDLSADIDQVLAKLERVEREIETRDKHWHLVRIAPYRTVDDRIDGVVLTFVDITARKKMEDALRATGHRLLEAQGSLEEQVEHRTHELASAIGRLDSEVLIRQEAERRVRSLLGRLITVQEDERRRIARDLHDHLGQQIAALHLRIESLRQSAQNSPPISDTLNEVETLIQRLDQDLDFFTWELRPATLDDLGIVVALGNFVREWSRNFSIPAKFHSHGLDDARLTPEIETTLYRIAQEALNNIYKHAQATNAGVVLERRDHEVVLVVEDNGRGFDRTFSTGEHSLGLMGMTERAALVGGSVEIESTPGMGTSVFVKMPASIAGAQ
jgi:two-component system CheB/CheR fusion protein